MNGNFTAFYICFYCDGSLRDCPSTSLIPGSEQGQLLASRLAKKLNKQVGREHSTVYSTVYSTVLYSGQVNWSYSQVFVSYNLPDDVLMTPLVIQKLVEEIKSNPDKF